MLTAISLIVSAASIAMNIILLVRLRRQQPPAPASKRWQLRRRPGASQHEIVDTKTGDIPSYINGVFNYWLMDALMGDRGRAEELVDFLNAQEPPEVGSAEWARLEAMKEIERIEKEAS